MHKIYVILFFLVEIGHPVSAHDVKYLPKEIVNSTVEEIAMQLLPETYNEEYKKMIEEVEYSISITSKETGIKKLSTKVLRAFSQVPRHLFVSPGDEIYAYINAPLSIGGGQTISQPFIVALMTELLDIKPNDKVLEIGTGSGYHIMTPIK